MPLFQRAVRPLGSMKHRYAGHPSRIVSTLLKFGFALHVFAEFGFMMVPTWGASMLPTFEVMGDWVVISKKFRRGKGVEVGDVVSFDSVVEPGEGVIKRVLALEGDYVLRNTPGTPNEEMLQIPQGHCWVVGDNMDYSRDSRHFGPLPMGLIRGKVIAKAFPWGERKRVANGIQIVKQ